MDQMTQAIVSKHWRK